jgi:hypothetical protein
LKSREYVLHVKQSEAERDDSLDRQTVRKAKILAARRETPMSGLVAA